MVGLFLLEGLLCLTGVDLQRVVVALEELYARTTVSQVGPHTGGFRKVGGLP